MTNIILFGAPGSGKGTQAEFIIEKFNLKHISTGDLLRKEIANGTELGTQAQEIMKQGKLVSDDIVAGMIANFVKSNIEAKGFIFDGYPRNSKQAETLDSILAENGTQIDSLVVLEVGKQELIERILNRAKTSGRADDADQSIIENRIAVYETETTPVMEHYAKQNKVQKINGVGSLDEISASIAEHLKTL